MIAVQVMANDVAVGFGGAGGYLEMNVYKPLMIFNITHSTTILSDGCVNFRKFLVEGTKPNLCRSAFRPISDISAVYRRSDCQFIIQAIAMRRDHRPSCWVASPARAAQAPYQVGEFAQPGDWQAWRWIHANSR
jgi:hypothetical protein